MKNPSSNPEVPNENFVLFPFVVDNRGLSDCLRPSVIKLIREDAHVRAAFGVVPALCTEGEIDAFNGDCVEALVDIRQITVGAYRIPGLMLPFAVNGLVKKVAVTRTGPNDIVAADLTPGNLMFLAADHINSGDEETRLLEQWIGVTNAGAEQTENFGFGLHLPGTSLAELPELIQKCDRFRRGYSHKLYAGRMSLSAALQSGFQHSLRGNNTALAYLSDQVGPNGGLIAVGGALWQPMILREVKDEEHAAQIFRTPVTSVMVRRPFGDVD